MRSNGIHYSLVLLLSAGALGLSSCGGGDGNSARIAQTVDASKNGITTIAIADNDGSVHTKGKFQFNLIGTDSAGKETNLNDKATWTLSDDSLGTIKNGFFTASGKMGENLTLTVSYASLTKSQPIALTDANLKSLSVEHATGSVDVCKNTTFIAKALFEDGKIYDYPVTWALVDNDSRTRANFADETKPELSTTKSGLVKVVAKAIDNFDKTVTSPEMQFTIDKTLTDLRITSNKDVEMRQGQTATLTVTGDYSTSASENIIKNVSLKSNNPNALTVNTTTGLITAVSGTFAGTEVNVSASCDDITKTLVIKVTKPDLQKIEIVGQTGTTSTESISVSVDSSVEPKIKVTYPTNTGIDPEIYSGKNTVWEITNTPTGYDSSKVTLDSVTGKVTISSSMIVETSMIVTLSVKLVDSDNKVMLGSDGTELKDTIQLTINR